MSSKAERTAKYALTKGLHQRGDEPTEAFSDNEDEQDDDSKLRENKESVQVVKARAASLRSRVPQTRPFSGAVPRNELVIDNHTDKKGLRLGFGVDGITTVSGNTVDAARNLDREGRTSLYQTSVNTRTEYGLDQRTQQAFLSFDVKAVLESFFDSKRYKYYMTGGVVLLSVSCYLFYYVYHQVRDYL